MSYIQSNRIYPKALFLVLALALLVFNTWSALAQGEQAETVYEPGAALLEIFKTDSIDKVSDLVPVIRTLWKRDLICTYSGRQWDKRENPWFVSHTFSTFVYTFLVPERYGEIGLDNPYIARFSFYYEAKQSGKYGFNIWHGQNACMLTIGGYTIVTALGPKRNFDSGTTEQGVCKLEKGFHRVEFWLISSLDAYRNNPYFGITVLTPDGFDAVPITKDMLLMKSAKTPSSQPYGWLGIVIQDLIVVKVFKSSPAERAGIREGDLILSFAGNLIKSTQELVNLIQTH
jgi:hypothetical protein